MRRTKDLVRNVSWPRLWIQSAELMIRYFKRLRVCPAGPFHAEREPVVRLPAGSPHWEAVSAGPDKNLTKILRIEELWKSAGNWRINLYKPMAELPAERFKPQTWEDPIIWLIRLKISNLPRPADMLKNVPPLPEMLQNGPWKY